MNRRAAGISAPRLAAVLAGSCLGLGLSCAAAAAKLQDCVDPKTKAVTKSDTCSTPQGPTAVEIVDAAEAQRLKDIEEQLRRDVKRADNQLLGRYPDEATYLRLRAADLAPVIRLVGQATARLVELVAERKPLDLEAEFYKGKPLPAWLHKKMEQSEKAFRELTQTFRDLEHDLAVLVKKYDDPRERLGKLWGGAAPGSMGPLVFVSGTAVARSK